MSTPRPLLALLPLLVLWLASCEEAAEPFTAEDVAACEGGDPLPEGAGKVTFPWFGKQSVMCVGDSVERQIAFVDFTDDAAQDSFGTVTLAADGTATGSFKAPAAWLRSGHTGRDEKLQGGQWLDAETHPEVSLAVTKMERLKPTVWRVDGTWTMRGVAKPVSFLANVRYVGEMQNVGKETVRVKASFDLDFRAYGVGGEWAGTPAVARTWTVDVVLLGVLSR
jgi:polyisoprenoid-binding protein YceI